MVKVGNQNFKCEAKKVEEAVGFPFILLETAFSYLLVGSFVFFSLKIVSRKEMILE